MKRLLSIFAVVLLSIGLFAMGSKGEFPTQDNAVATDKDSVPRDRRDPPPAMDNFQYNDNAVATDKDSVPRDRRDPPPAMDNFQFNDNAVATDKDSVPRDRRDPPPVMSELTPFNSAIA